MHIQTDRKIILQFKEALILIIIPCLRSWTSAEWIVTFPISIKVAHVFNYSNTWDLQSPQNNTVNQTNIEFQKKISTSWWLCLPIHWYKEEMQLKYHSTLEYYHHLHVPGMQTLSFENMRTPFATSMNDNFWGVVTITAALTGTTWKYVSSSQRTENLCQERDFYHMLIHNWCNF